jgi:hypothetical protein
MNENLAFYALKTVPGFPLGIPVDGRQRFGMTPEQAIVYRWLVKYRPHDRAFAVDFGELGRTMLSNRSNAFFRVRALVERGWLTHDNGNYRFVEPVMDFKARRNV